MGQVDSKINNDMIFAYQVNPKKLHYQPLIKSDPILSQPARYGFKDGFSFFTKRLDRPDSGYMSHSYDESIQLAHDVAYVDNTYYPSTRYSYDHDVGMNDDSLVISFTDIVSASPDKTLTEVYLSFRAIKRLSSNISMLTMIRKLDLSNNYLTELPDAIGYLRHLETLTVTKNCLISLPDTLCHLSSLIELDASYNQLQSVTPYIGCLKKLKSLSLAVNQITQLPTEIRGLADLISLDVSRNPLRVLPVEVARLPLLRRIRCEECPFDQNLTYTLKHDPPRLFELCARALLVKNIPLGTCCPEHIAAYIKSAKICSSCHGPYFESFVMRGRFIEKSEVMIPLQYTLCSTHWTEADDRLMSMFSTVTRVTPDILPYRPILPALSIEKPMSMTRRPYSPHPPESIIATDTPKLYNENNNSKSTLSKFTISFKRSSVPW